MSYRWSPAKRASNLVKHGVDFQAAEGFGWPGAVVRADTRRTYGEVRMTAVGAIGDRLHVMVFTIRRPDIWVISLRKASTKEIGRYEGQG